MLVVAILLMVPPMTRCAENFYCLVMLCAITEIVVIFMALWGVREGD